LRYEMVQKRQNHFPGSRFAWTRRDFCISDEGRIEQVAPVGVHPAKGEVIEIEDLCVSPGWVDAWAQVGEPGLEYRETYATAAAAARRGGFTHVCVLPNTKPSMDNQAQGEDGRQCGQGLRCHLFATWCRF
jgi:dihydroorotase-like cyclic amidohydrolase